MATDLNRVLLIGRLTREPELRQTGSGTSYCKFSIANNRNYTANGERKEEVSFFNCVAWARQAEIINQYCRKGKQVAIDGRLQQRSWVNTEGKKQYATDIVVDSLQMLGSPGEGGGQQSGGGDYASQQSGGGYGGGNPQGGGGGYSGGNPQGGGGGGYGGGNPQGGGGGYGGGNPQGGGQDYGAPPAPQEPSYGGGGGEPAPAGGGFPPGGPLDDDDIPF